MIPTTRRPFARPLLPPAVLAAALWGGPLAFADEPEPTEATAPEETPPVEAPPEPELAVPLEPLGTTTLTPEVRVSYIDRYRMSIDNDDVVDVTVDVTGRAPVVVAPGTFEIVARRSTKKATASTTFTEADPVAVLQGRHDRLVQAYDRLMERVEQADADAADPAAYRERLRQEAITDFLEVFEVGALGAIVLHGFDPTSCTGSLWADLDVRNEAPGNFLACVQRTAPLSPLDQIALTTGYTVLRRAIEKTPPDPAVALAALQEQQATQEAGLMDSARRILAAQEGGEVQLAPVVVSLPEIHVLKADATPYATLALGVTVLEALKPGTGWRNGGRVGWHAEIDYPLSPEIYLGGSKVAGFLRLMGTAAVEETSIAATEEPWDDAAVRLSWFSTMLGAQLRTTIHPLGYVDLGFGLEVPMGHAVTVWNGAPATDSISPFSFEPPLAHPGAKTWGQVRVGMNIPPRLGLTKRSSGVSVWVAQRLRQMPQATGSLHIVDETVTIPSGDFYSDFRVGLMFGL